MIPTVQEVRRAVEDLANRSTKINVMARLPDPDLPEELRELGEENHIDRRIRIFLSVLPTYSRNFHETVRVFFNFFWELNFHVSFHFFRFCVLSGIFLPIVRRDANALQALFFPYKIRLCGDFSEPGKFAEKTFFGKIEIFLKKRCIFF